MQVNLKSLAVNPFRDLIVDPIDDAAVEAIKESIEQDGFWGGVVVRQSDSGELQIAAGHHRVKAAIAAGMKMADLFIGDIDDEGMIRIYARENATQRGNGSTAVAGTVASAVRFLAEKVCWGNFSSTSSKAPKPDAAEIGWRLILQILDGIPGVNEGTVRAQLANLKSSGDYARIIREVQAEIDEQVAIEQERIRKAVEAEERVRIEAEARAAREAEEAERKAEAARKAAEKAKRDADAAAAKRAEADRIAAQARAEEARKRQVEADRVAQERKRKLEEESQRFESMRAKASTAADKASSREIDFDFAGVAKFFKNENQVRVFRELVTAPGVKPYLAVDKQAMVARQLVELANERDVELSGAFIKAEIMTQITGVYKARDAAKREQAKEDLERLDREQRMRLAQRDFSRNASGIRNAAVDISDLAKAWPKRDPMPVSDEFKTALSNLEFAVKVLKQRGLI